ncbi:hypothetical protein V500_08808 [Pseudogymnoascus sp. VKM F-4518 (FW-2643)]|nr:hypothetical protein V500_08808 [Pseudogymnoascus sp. VKM F-4518 (FW-2643)]
MQSSLSTLSGVLCVASMLSMSLASLVEKSCINYTIQVTPTSLNHIFNKPFQNNYEVVDFFTNANSRGAAAANFTPFSGAVVQTATYEIAATFCSPAAPGHANSTVIVATHGLAFDKSYWDPTISPEKYSFVDFAVARGYSVFTYDRLGVGKSSSVSGFLNQASIQVAILQELATAVKSGNYTGAVGVPKSLVLIGHSFGSVLTAAAITASPALADGVILTGFSYNGTNGAWLETLQPRIATAESEKWNHLDSGYLVAADPFSSINVFLKAPDYTADVANYAWVNRVPFAISEGVSGDLVNTTATDFRGAAMILSGQFDYIFCSGDCDTVIENPAAAIFAKAKAFKAVSYPGSGHGLNLATNATGSFEIITDFLGSNGL